MSLPIQTKEKLKATYGFDVDKLIEAIKADAEVEFAVPEDVTVIKTADLTTRDTNNKEAGKTEGKKEGEQHGKELAAKSLKKKLALPETVGNDLDKVIEAANEQLSKGDAGLKEQITLLQKDKGELEQKLTAEQKRAQQAAFDSELIASFPANRTPDLTDAERLALVKMNLSFEEHEGKKVVKKNGEIVRHKDSQDPLPAKDVIATLFTEKKWVKEEAGSGGRGGGNSGGGGNTSGIKKASDFEMKWKAENPNGNVISTEYSDAMNKHAKDTPDFDFYN